MLNKITKILLTSGITIAFTILVSSCSLTSMPAEDNAAKKEQVTQSKLAKPNVIYIIVDDLGIGDIEPYGQEKIRTPHLQKMAEQGLTFTQHYAGNPVCAPSRAQPRGRSRCVRKPRAQPPPPRPNRPRGRPRRAAGERGRDPRPSARRRRPSRRRGGALD